MIEVCRFSDHFFQKFSKTWKSWNGSIDIAMSIIAISQFLERSVRAAAHHSNGNHKAVILRCCTFESIKNWKSYSRKTMNNIRFRKKSKSKKTVSKWSETGQTSNTCNFLNIWSWAQGKFLVIRIIFLFKKDSGPDSIQQKSILMLQ